MDSHICIQGTPVDDSAGAGLALIDAIKQRGGVALLNWHTETVCNDYQYAGVLPVLLKIIEDVLQDSEVWLPTPAELVRHWNERRLRLETAAFN
jgi:hypothetical protein